MIESVEGANEKMASEPSKKEREKVKTIRHASLDTETQEVPDQIRLFFDLAKGAVERDLQPDR